MLVLAAAIALRLEDAQQDPSLQLPDGGIPTQPADPDGVAPPRAPGAAGLPDDSPVGPDGDGF